MKYIALPVSEMTHMKRDPRMKYITLPVSPAVSIPCETERHAEGDKLSAYLAIITDYDQVVESWFECQECHDVKVHDVFADQLVKDIYAIDMRVFGQ